MRPALLAPSLCLLPERNDKNVLGALLDPVSLRDSMGSMPAASRLRVIARCERPFDLQGIETIDELSHPSATLPIHESPRNCRGCVWTPFRYTMQAGSVKWALDRH